MCWNISNTTSVQNGMKENICAFILIYSIMNSMNTFRISFLFFFTFFVFPFFFAFFLCFFFPFHTFPSHCIIIIPFFPKKCFSPFIYSIIYCGGCNGDRTAKQISRSASQPQCGRKGSEEKKVEEQMTVNCVIIRITRFINDWIYEWRH